MLIRIRRGMVVVFGLGGLCLQLGGPWNAIIYTIIGLYVPCSCVCNSSVDAPTEG